MLVIVQLKFIGMDSQALTAGVVSAGVGIVAGIVLALFSVTKEVSNKYTYFLAPISLAIIPLMLVEKAILSAVNAIGEALLYPQRVAASFSSWETDIPACQAIRDEATNSANNFEFPNADTFKKSIEENVQFIYVIAGVSTFLSILVGLGAKWSPVKGISYFINVVTWLVYCVIFGVFVGLCYTLTQLCEDHIEVDSLNADVRWFVDSTASNDDGGGRPWVSDLDDFFTKCENSAPPEVLSAMNPGGLEDEYEQLYDSICKDAVSSFLGIGIVHGGTVLLWGTSVLLLLTVYKKSSYRVGTGINGNPVKMHEVLNF